MTDDGAGGGPCLGDCMVNFYVVADRNKHIGEVKPTCGGGTNISDLILKYPVEMLFRKVDWDRLNE